MAQNTLKARLEVVGGEKLVRTFEAIGTAAERNFDRIDREADQSARRVRALERELLRLQAVAKTIRAGVKIDVDKGPTAAQAKALALAQAAEDRAKRIRAQMGDIDTSLAQGRGRALRSLVDGLDRDRLESVRAAEDIRRRLDELKDDGEARSHLSDEDERRLRDTADRLEAVSDTWLDANRDRVAKVDAAEEKAEKKRLAADARLKKAAADRAAAEAEEAEKAARADTDRAWAAHEADEKAAHAAAASRVRDAEKADREFREKADRFRRDDYSAWWADQIDRRDVAEKLAKDQAAAAERAAAEADADRRRRLKSLADFSKDLEAAIDRDRSKRLKALAAAQEEKDAVAAKELAERERYEAKASAEEEKRLGRQRAALRKLSGDWEKIAAARRAGSLADVEVTEELERRRDGKARGVAARLGVPGPDRPAPGRLDSILGEGVFSEEQIARIRKMDASIRRADSAIGRFVNNMKLKAVVPDADAAARAVGRVGDAAESASKRGVSGFTRLGRGILGAGTNVKKLVGNLKSLEYSLGNVALRTAVGGVLGGLGLGIGAAGVVGTGAVIAGAGGLAGFDVASIGRQAKSLGLAVDYFSRLRYAADRTGVGIEGVSGAFSNLRQAIANAQTGELDPFLQSMEDGKNPYGVTLKLIERQKNALGEEKRTMRDVRDVWLDLVRAFSAMPEGPTRRKLAEALGVTELIPLLERGEKGLAELFAMSDRLGMTVDTKQAAEMQALRERVYDMWASVIGLGYRLADAMAPYIETVAARFVDFVTRYRTEIVDFLVGVYVWVEKTVADFIRLFTYGAGTDTYFGWTKTFYVGIMNVVAAFWAVWNAVKVGYGFARPYLDKLGEWLGLGSGQGLTVALGLLAVNLLGLVGLALDFGKTLISGFTLVAGLVTGVALPAIGLVATALAAIVGWPALLLAGGGLVGTYWDTVSGYFQAAWAKFKATFPETARELETAFLEASKPIKRFIDTVMSITAPIRWVFDAAAGLIRLFTGSDITGLGLMVGLLAFGNLLTKVIGIVGTLRAALFGVGLAGGAAAGGGLVAAFGAVATAIAGMASAITAALAPAFALLIGPAGWFALAGTALGFFLVKLLDFLGLTEKIKGVIDDLFFKAGRDDAVAGYRAADEDYQRRKEANGGRIPGVANPEITRLVNAQKPLISTTGNGWLNMDPALFAGSAEKATKFASLLDTINSIDLPDGVDAQYLTLQQTDLQGHVGRPINLYLPGYAEPMLVYSQDTNIEQKLSDAARRRMAAPNSWQR